MTDFPLRHSTLLGTHEKKMETNVNHAKKILAKNLRILALDREKLEVSEVPTHRTQTRRFPSSIIKNKLENDDAVMMC